MRAISTILRWILLLVGIAMFLLNLKSAAYRAWLAGGPPTPNPEGWLFSAWNYLSWSLAFLSSGIGVFLALGGRPRLIRVGIALLALAIAFWAFPHIREFVAKDACLDAGGKWTGKELRCTYE